MIPSSSKRIPEKRIWGMISSGATTRARSGLSKNAETSRPSAVAERAVRKESNPLTESVLNPPEARTVRD